MPLSNRRTLTQYLIEQRRRFPQASGALNALILDVALATKAIARAVAFGELGDPMSRQLVAAAQSHAQVNVQGEVQKPLDVVSNEIFIRTTEWSGHLAGMGSEEMDAPYQIPSTYTRGKYLLVFDPLDGSSNIDVNVSVGSIFSILRAPQASRRFRPRRDRSGLPAAGHGAGRGRLCDLRPGDDAGADGRQRRGGLHARSQPRRVQADASGHPRPGGVAGVCDQYQQQPFLGAADQALCRRVPGRQDRAARQGLQHALDRQHGGRGASHPDAGWRVHVSARHEGFEQAWTPAPAVRGESDRFRHGAGRRSRQQWSHLRSRSRAGVACISASAWCSGRRTKWSASSAITPSTTPARTSPTARRSSTSGRCTGPKR